MAAGPYRPSDLFMLFSVVFFMVHMPQGIDILSLVGAASREYVGKQPSVLLRREGGAGAFGGCSQLFY
jgi:hypothetical protein